MSVRIRATGWELFQIVWAVYQVLKEAYQNRRSLLRVVRFLRRIHIQLSITERLIGFRIRVPPGMKILPSKPIVVKSEIRGERQRIHRLFLWRKGRKYRTFEVRESLGRFPKIELWIDGKQVRFARRRLSLRRPWQGKG